MGRASQRHRRGITLVALAVVAMAFATAAYLRPVVIQQRGTLASTTSYPPAPQSSGLVAPRSAYLIPDGATRVLVQEYWGLNDQPPLGLRAAALIRDSQAISRIVLQLNALPAYPSISMWCGYGDGSYFAVDFAYANGTSTAVKMEATGCHGVYLGGWEQPVAWAVNTPQLFDTLTDLIANEPRR